MKELLASFPWSIPIICLCGWVAIIIVHGLFISVAPKEEGQVDPVLYPEKKRIIEAGNNLFQISWWNLILISIAHFITIFDFIPWVVFIISSIFSVISVFSCVVYIFASFATIFAELTHSPRASFAIFLSIVSELIETAALVYTSYSIYVIYIL